MTVAKETQPTYTILSKGSTGDDVKHVQNLLNYVYGPDLKVDGIFGHQTEEAVKKFQKDYELVVDGIVGPYTWKYLIDIRSQPITPQPTLRHGSTGDEVKYLQDLLNYFGNSLTIDGIFGSKTEAAVKKFQHQYGLVVDGIVGLNTWRVLLEQFHH